MDHLIEEKPLERFINKLFLSAADRFLSEKAFYFSMCVCVINLSRKFEDWTKTKLSTFEKNAEGHLSLSGLLF